MNSNKIKENFKFEAFAQMFLLVFSIVAFSYAIGSEVKGVSALTPQEIINLMRSTSVGTSFKTTNTPGTEVEYTLEEVNGNKVWAYMAGNTKAYTDNPSLTWERFNTAKSSGSVIVPSTSSAPAPQTSVPPAAAGNPAPNPSRTICHNEGGEEICVPDLGIGSGTATSTKSILDGVVGKYAEVKVGSTTLVGNVEQQFDKDGKTVTGYTLKTTGDKTVIFDKTGKVTNAGGVSGIEGASVSGAALTFNSAAFAKEFGANLLYTLAVYTAVKFFGGLFGIKDAALEPLSKGAALGFFVASNLEAAAKAQSTTFSWATNTGWFGWQYATWAGVGIGAAYFISEYREVDTKTVQFNCIPWQAPTGGSDCEKCNAQKSGLPCSEYQCRSLGQSCELVNKGTTKEICAWVNRNDVNPPVVEVFNEALLSNKYKYNPDGAVLPPDRGAIVEYSDSTDKCIPAFTPLKFGVSLNEPARCKIDSLRKDKFENMTLFMDQGLYLYNHTFALALPGTDNLNSEGITVQNDGNYQLFVRCEDSNGNANIGTFVFKYCVQKGPDTTPPLVISTSIPNNMPVAFNQSSVELQVYVNEPAECKWSHNNRDYNSMEKQMSCNTALGDANSQGLYTCETTLDGLKDRVDNQFFFRCKDKPTSIENERNENSESFQFNIIGTQALVIDSVAPNETIKDSTTAVKATIEARTSAGFDRGNSTCYYSDTGEEESYVQFFNTNSFRHSQDLFLSEGFYNYYIKCIDLGGNTANETVNFDVETDNSAPVVARAYREDNYMKLITDEEAQCVYDNVDCNYPFSDGIKMTNIDETNHFTDWNIKTNLYVKCKDTYGNEPLPNQCSITVKSSNL